MICIDAQTIAEQLTGEHLAANLVLVGAALQAGHLPLSESALDEAIRLNGVDVDTSRAAVMWGRAAVADPGLVEQALHPVAESPPLLHPIVALPAQLTLNESWPELLRQVVSRRVTELVAFQSKKLALRYLKLVEHVAEQEEAAIGNADLMVTEAFARGCFSLMATKDEYEVARLHLLTEEQEAFETAFPGARRVYLLKPPLLAALGLKRKIKLVRSARPAFTILRGARRLRGTPFDVFGWTEEHRFERRFFAEYLQNVDQVMTYLSPETVAEVLAVVDSANRVHGYSHVRRASIATVRSEVEGLNAALLSRSAKHEGERSYSTPA
jgi:indolepyruvate ferredoxin oxidoreductase